MKKVFHITKQGKADLEKELKELIDARGEVAEAIATARELGDLSENAEYTVAKERQNQSEARIAEIEEILGGAQIIAADGDGTVSIGDLVVVSLNGKESTFNVVGAVEADPTQNKISFESPLGSALMGKKVGDKVVFSSPSGEKVYTIVKVN